MNEPPLLVCVSFDAIERPTAEYDALIVVAPSPVAESLRLAGAPTVLCSAVDSALAIDAALARGPSAPAVIAAAGLPGARLVLAVTGALTDETDDVRNLSDATAAAVQRAVTAGARRPLLYVVSPADERFTGAAEVCALAALGTRWWPLEAREASRPTDGVERVGVVGLSADAAARVRAVEVGRWLCRDITGTEPERMAPRRVGTWCVEQFAGTGVRVTVEDDVSAYPLLAAVARASQTVERHRPCVVRLEYVPEGVVHRTILIAGKGVTYDTGGADLKTDGAMAGMSRDKGGAGAAAGFVRTMAAVRAPGVRVIALLGMVRNSVGEESYVSDEIITGRSGVRVRIGNTDAEGRLVLADLLACLREGASAMVSPVFVSIATLTGHVHRAFGPYTGALENAAARKQGVLRALCAAGDRWGEPIEWTLPRREDYAFVAARSTAEDCVSSNRLPSVATPRGHQGPYAFLDIASGIRGSGLPFVHLDIGGAAFSPADWQFGRPTGAPVATLVEFARVDAR